MKISRKHNIPFMSLIKWVICLFFSLSIFSESYAQIATDYTVKGRVVDEVTKQPLEGVSVIIKDRSTTGTTTNKNGEFSLQANNKDVLAITFTGYVDFEISVKDITGAPIQMHPKTGDLDEIVVVGYGTVRKRDLTGSVGLVGVKDMTKAPVPTFDQALAGRVAGVQVSSNEGQPGADINIVIRGGNSLTQSNAPLYVIDGFPIEDFSNATINPDDIESMSVLKDASATAIYGARGANGVIIIETKRGKVGPPDITYNGYAGVQTVTKRMEMMDPYEFVRYQLELNPNNMTKLYLTGPGKTLDDYKNVEKIDWQDLAFQNAFMHNHNISLRGGSGQTKYLFTGSMVDQDGVIINSGFKRHQVRLAIDQSISKKLKANFNINYTNDKTYGALASVQASETNSWNTFLMYRILAYRPLSNAGDIINDLFDEELDGGGGTGSILLMNPIIPLKNEIRQRLSSNVMMNGAINYDIAKGLSLKVTGGYNLQSGKRENFYNSKTYQGYPTSVNTKGVNGSYSNVTVADWMNENVLTYKKQTNNGNSFDITGAMTIQGTERTIYGYTVTNIPVSNEGLGLRALQLGLPTDVVSEAYKNTLMSFMGRINYSIQSKYLFTASLRADGSSRFSPQNRWGYFPSAAFAWNMGEENFLKNSSFISDAKLRISYGVTGNNRVGDFSRFSSIELSEYYSFNNGEPLLGAVISNLGTGDLRWERTSQLDIGYDLSLLKNRINFTVDFYSKTTSDLLLSANLPYSSGFQTAYKNIGSVRNNGLEFSLHTVNVEGKDFKWESNFNISFNKNKVVALSEGQTNILSTISFTSIFNTSNLYIAQLGGPAAAFYGFKWDGNYQFEDFDRLENGTYRLKSTVTTNGSVASTIQPGDIKYVDQNGDLVVDEKDLVVIGNPIPRHFGGFNNNFSYKGFDLNVFLQWSYGNDIMNANRLLFEGSFHGRSNINQYAVYANRWTPDNPTNEYYRAGGAGPRGVYSDRTIEDGSYLRIKTVQLAYTFPKRFFSGKIKAMQIYSGIQNLYTWTKYTGMDPEVSTKHSTLTPGFDYSSYPRGRTVTLGLKVNF